MRIQEAIEFIENFEIPERLTQSKEAIKKSLSNLPKNDFEEIGTHYYYLLRVILRSHILFETDSAKYFYRKMKDHFKKQEEKYQSELKNNKNKEVIKLQFDVFYQMMERYYSSLEVVFDKKDFREAKQKAFEDKMNYRKNAYFTRKQYGKFLGYKFLELSSNYGASFLRWGITSLFFIIIFASIFGIFTFLISPTISSVHWYDYFHFSASTFTTLGFGDIAPISIIGKIIADLEVFVGFIMLGVLVGFVQKKLI